MSGEFAYLLTPRQQAELAYLAKLREYGIGLMYPMNSGYNTTAIGFLTDKND